MPLMRRFLQQKKLEPNLKHIKGIVKEWDFKKRQREDQEIKEVERDFQSISNSIGEGFNNVEAKETLVRLEGKTKYLLDLKEAT